MAGVIDVLRDEHLNIARLLTALEHQMDVFAEAGEPDYDVIGGVAAYFLDFPDRCHHPKENVVFARLRQAHPDETAAIGDLTREHAAIHERAQRFGDTIRALLGETDIARSVVVDAARAFIDAERRHLRMEEERFFPLAERLLGPADWLRIEGDLTTGTDPLFGGRIEARFKSLSERLLAWEQEDEAWSARARGGPG
jgi:hemerythrin-like domain-containing protein